jgi:hypothetical protein
VEKASWSLNSSTGTLRAGRLISALPIGPRSQVVVIELVARYSGWWQTGAEASRVCQALSSEHPPLTPSTFRASPRCRDCRNLDAAPKLASSTPETCRDWGEVATGSRICASSPLADARCPEKSRHRSWTTGRPAENSGALWSKSRQTGEKSRQSGKISRRRRASCDR